jgi:LPS export ABC transporter protein LptC
MVHEESSKRHEGLSAWWAVREVDSLFARLGRYTRFVLYGKWSLLLAALLLTASLIIWPLVSVDKSGLRISFVDSNAVKQLPTSPVMDNPEYSGNGKNGQQYKITGKTATQKSATLIIIDTVEATMTKQDGGWRILTAQRGEYHQDAKRMDLFGNVTLVDGQGTNFVTEQASIETETSRVYGTNPIIGEGNMGKLVASGFEITDNGDHIRFTGDKTPVKVTITRAAKKP